MVSRLCSTRKASEAIAAVSAFFRHRQGKAPGPKSTYREDDDVYSDVSESEWGDNEEESVYSSIELRETPYSSHILPQASITSPVQHKPLPPIPGGEYSYATAGDGRTEVDGGQVFYSLSVGCAQESKFMHDAAASSVPNDDMYFAVGQPAAPLKVPLGKTMSDAPRLESQRSQSPQRDNPSAPVAKSKPAKPARPPARPPPAPAFSVRAKKAGLQPIPPPPAVQNPKPTITDIPNESGDGNQQQYSEVDLNRKIPAVQRKHRSYSADSWGDTLPPPLAERIRTSSLQRDVMGPRSTPSPDTTTNADTLRNDADDSWEGGSVDTFTPGSAPPRLASMSASETSGDTEFKTVLQRHRARQEAAPRETDECSEDEDELTNNEALGTICSSGASDRDSRTNTLDRVVFTCSVESDKPVSVRSRSMIVESNVPGQEDARLSYINVTLPRTDDTNMPFYQNTDEALGGGKVCFRWKVTFGDQHMPFLFLQIVTRLPLV